MGALADAWRQEKQKNTMAGGSAGQGLSSASSALRDEWSRMRPERMQQSVTRLNREMEELQKQAQSRKSYWDGNDENIRKRIRETNEMMLLIENRAKRYNMTDAYDASSMEQYKKYNADVLSALDADAQRFGQFKTEAEYNNYAKAYAEQQKKQAAIDAENEKYRKMSVEEIDKELQRIDAEKAAYKKKSGGYGRQMLQKATNSMNWTNDWTQTDRNGNLVDRMVASSNTELHPEKKAINDSAETKKRQLEAYDAQRSKLLQVLGEKMLETLSPEAVNALDVINDAREMIKNAIVNTPEGDSAVTNDAYKRIEQASATLKKLGYAEWEELAEARGRQQNAEQMQELIERTQKDTQKHPHWSDIASIGAQAVRGVSAAKDVATMVMGGDIDTNDASHIFGQYADTVRGTRQEMIDEKYDTKAGKVAARVAYNVGMGVADNLVRMGIGYATGGAAYASTISGALMGSQVMSQAIVEGKQKGYSDEKAVGMALVQAAIEAATEKWSVEAVLKDSKNVFLQVGKAMIAEGSEEVASNAANYIADALANGDENDLRKAYDRYRLQGMSDKDALKAVIWDVVKENTEAFIVGGLSGAVLGAGSSVVFDQRRKAYGDLMIQSGAVNDLLDDAEGRKDKELQKYAEKVKGTEKPSARAVGNLVLRLDELGEDKAAIVEKYVSGKRLSEADREAVRSDPKVRQMIEEQGVEPERRALQEGDLGNQALMATAEYYKGTAAESSYVDNYRAGQNVDNYFAAHDAVYRMAADGYKFEDVEAMFGGEWTDDFTREQAIEAHRAGFREGTAAVSEPFAEIQVEDNSVDVIRSAEMKNGVTLVNVQKRLNATMRTQLAVLQNFGKEKGIAFAVVDDYSRRYANINGAQLEGTNKIIVNLDAEGGLLLRTAGHEVFHFIEQQNAEAAQKLRDFVVDHFVKEGKYESLAQKYAQQGYEGNIDSELTADNLFDVMTQEGFLQKYAGEDAGTVRTLRNTVAAFIRHINNALKLLKVNNPIHKEIYKSLNKDKQFLEELRRKATEALDSLPSAQSGTRTDAKRSEGVKHSQKYREETEDYKKDITKNDVRTIQTIGEKSIKDFTSEEIQKAKKWAHKFYKELGSKSPFFRAWFGDWRAYDKSKVKVVDVPTIDIKDAVLEKGTYTISDTGWNVYAGRTLDKDTRHHSGGNRINVKALTAVEKILDNAVLLDTRVSNRNTKTKSENTVFLHKLYTVFFYDNKPFLAISTVEEFYDESKKADSLRAYNLKAIKIEPAGGREGKNPTTPDVGKDSTSISIAELFGIVKQHDERFTEGKPVDENLLNPDGTPKVMYRGGAERINIFDRKKSRASNLYGRGFYFTEDKNAAARYGDVREYYLRIEHPLTPGKHTLKKEQFRRFLSAIESGYDEDWDLYNYGENYSIDALADSFAKKGDFEALQDISATAVGDLVACIEAFNEINGTKYDGIILPTETVVFDSKQIKSATDNIGTFDRNNPDVHFSLKPASSISEERRALIEENEKYKALIGKLNGQLHALQKKVVDPKGVRKLARDVRAEFKSKISQSELEEKLTSLFDYIANEQDIDFSQIMRVTAEIAKDVISQSDALNTELTEQYADLRAYLKTTKLQLTSLQKNEMAVQFDGYENFRRRNFGKIRFTKDGVKLDEVWGELCERYPEFFHADEHEAEMPLRLMDAIEATNPFHENPYGMNMDEAAYDLALRIYDAYYDIPEVGSLQRQIDDLRAEYKEKYKKAMQKTRTEYEGKLAEQVARLERRGLPETRRRAVSQVLQSANALAKKLAANSAKKNVPDVLKGPVMGLLDTISAYSESGRVTELNKSFFENLRKAHERLTDLYKDGSDDALENVYAEHLDLTEDFMEQIRQLRRDVDDLLEVYSKDKRHVLQMMDLTQLDVLNRVLVQMHHMVTKAGELHQNELYRNANDLARDTIRDLSAMQERSAHKSAVGDKLETFLGWTNATPYYVFKRFGAAGLSIFNEMQTGWDNFAFRIRDVRDYALNAYTAKEAQAWEKDVRTFEDKSGKEFCLTIPQVMSIYCLSKREAARRHLLGGGITPGKVGKYQQSQRYKLDEQTLDAIIGALSERQVEVADKLQNFLSTTCAEWGNAVSMKRFGIRIFTEKFYFPMAVDQNTVSLGDTPKLGSGLFDLINRSFTKELNDKASNALYAQNIFDVFTAHATDMAQYNALALPVLDMMKWYNGTVSAEDQAGENEGTSKQNVRAELERVFGAQAKTYIDQFVRDINGSTSEDRSIGKSFMRNFKVAKVAANLNVALVQPTAYVRAGNMLDPKYLFSAMSGMKDIRKHIAEMQQYSGIGLWKGMGFFDVDVNRSLSTIIKHSESTADKMREQAMKGAEVMDNVTWGLLFYACQKWAYKEKGLAFGSEACNKAAAEKFREVVYATQVVDSTMTRSALMRSKGTFDQITSAFMSEPTLSYNMVMDQFFAVQKDVQSGMTKRQALQKNGKTIARMVGVYCTTAIVTALAEAVTGALRDEDDDEYSEKYKKAFIDNLLGDLSLLQKIPFVKYFAEAAKAVIEKKSASYSNPTTQVFEEFTSTVNALRSGNVWEYRTVYKLLTFLSDATGLPASSLTREVVAVWNTVIGELHPELKLRRYDEPSNKAKVLKIEEDEDVQSRIGDILDAAIKARQKKHPHESPQESEKEAKSSLKSSVTSAAHDIYDGGDTERARRLMQQSGLYEAKDIQKKMDDWAKE